MEAYLQRPASVKEKKKGWIRGHSLRVEGKKTVREMNNLFQGAVAGQRASSLLTSQSRGGVRMSKKLRQLFG